MSISDINLPLQYNYIINRQKNMNRGNNTDMGKIVISVALVVLLILMILIRKTLIV